MSLLLEMGTEPHRLYTNAMDDWVAIGDYTLSLVDFLALAQYVLSNTNLVPNDPRVAFVDAIRDSMAVPGWGDQGTRLQLSEALREWHEANQPGPKEGV